jgi:hypothetical protein
MGNLCADRTHCQSQTRLRINLKQGPKPRADDVSSILRDATRPRQRRILPVEDHDFPEALRGRLLGVIERGIILCPLLAPRRCIAIPMVFYRCAQESASEMPRPRTLANIVRRSRVCRGYHTGRKSSAAPKPQFVRSTSVSVLVLQICSATPQAVATDRRRRANETRHRSTAAYAADTGLMECLLLNCGALLVVANLDQLSFYLSHFVRAHLSAWRRVVQVRVLRYGAGKTGACRKYPRN